MIVLVIFTAQFAFADLSVTMTNPSGDATYSAKSNITLTATPLLTSGTFKDIRFYYGNTVIGKATGDPLSYVWKNVKSGNYNVFARVRDTDNNQADSDTIHIRVGNVSNGDVLKNGDFDINIAPWQLQNNQGAASTAHIYNDMYFEDSSYIYIDITNGSTENWHIQLWQNVPLVPDHTYEIWFYSDAEERKTIQIAMQMNQDPWTTYYAEDVVIDGAGEYGPYTFVNTFTDPGNVFKFNIAGNTIDIFFDRVRIIDRTLTSVTSRNLFTKNGIPVEYELFHSYPNPFNMNTNIQYRLSKPANVILNIYNMRGQLVKSLVDEKMSAGLYTARWDGTDNNSMVVPSGVYVYRMEIPADKVQLTSKVILIK